ncbi:gluconokinase [Gymnodinialimonas sp. 2305UL16-5]|uniref:gluconokinase n=1 Tax=Gymnodinialimonas mytili TaxID=3126503 RepID=UPI003095BD8B
MPLGGRYIVMGVAGAGKSHIGAAFAHRTGATFIDGDDLHPPANIAKMSRGDQLTDTDRWPWLTRVGTALTEGNSKTGIVIGCSALKRAYRDHIRSIAGEVTFVLLDGSYELLTKRMSARTHHFMPTSLLDGQLATLERPDPDETAIVVGINAAPDAIVTDILTQLTERTPS